MKSILDNRPELAKEVNKVAEVALNQRKSRLKKKMSE